MKIVGLMLARNEDWVLRASVRAALAWVDQLWILDHASTDDTRDILSGFCEEFPGRIIWPYFKHELGVWNEMEMREFGLEVARRLNATHVAMIDADEILTANLIPHIRGWVEALRDGEVLELPMVPTWRSLDQYRADNSVWSHAWLSLAFKDRPGLAWKSQVDGYQHHARTPYGCGQRIRRSEHGQGGVFHLQFADWNRLVAKHRLYKMRDWINYPTREPVQIVDARYSEALDESGLQTRPVPREWWYPCKDQIVLGAEPWHKKECEALLAKYGLARFEGLNLWGWPAATASAE